MVMNFMGQLLSLGVVRHFWDYLFSRVFFPGPLPILYDNDGTGVQPILVN